MTILTNDHPAYDTINDAIEQKLRGREFTRTYYTGLRDRYNGAEEGAILQEEVEPSRVQSIAKGLVSRGLEDGVDFTIQVLDVNIGDDDEPVRKKFVFLKKLTSKPIGEVTRRKRRKAD